jgi:hypothetical protein
MTKNPALSMNHRGVLEALLKRLDGEWSRLVHDALQVADGRDDLTIEVSRLQLVVDVVTGLLGKPSSAAMNALLAAIDSRQSGAPLGSSHDG